MYVLNAMQYVNVHNYVYVATCMLISFTLVSERKAIMHKLSGGVETLIKTLQVLGEAINTLHTCKPVFLRLRGNATFFFNRKQRNHK